MNGSRRGAADPVAFRLPAKVVRRLVGNRSGVRMLAVTLLLVVAGCAVLARILARSDFTSMGEAAWWAVQTVTTVGSGDIVPESNTGRGIAAVLMVTAIALVSLLTASIEAAFVDEGQRKRGAADEQPVLDALARLEQRLERIERSLAPPEAPPDAAAAPSSEPPRD